MPGWVILSVIVINAAFAFIQEYKAERAVQSLRDMLPDKAWVTRSGLTLEVSRSDIVVGNILILEEGERIPADARLIEAAGMRVDNAALTGESNPTRRTAEVVPNGHWLDLPNLVFAGTTMYGRTVVFATGMHSEFGKIAHLTSTIETGLSPLQKEIMTATHIVTMISLGMEPLFFAIGLWTGPRLLGERDFRHRYHRCQCAGRTPPYSTLALAAPSKKAEQYLRTSANLPPMFS